MDILAVLALSLIIACCLGPTIVAHVAAWRHGSVIVMPVRVMSYQRTAELPAVAPSEPEQPAEVVEHMPERMPEVPPAAADRELTAEQRKVIKKLIAAGASRTDLVALLGGNTQRRYQQVKGVLDEQEVR